MHAVFRLARRVGRLRTSILPLRGSVPAIGWHLANLWLTLLEIGLASLPGFVLGGLAAVVGFCLARLLG